MDIEHNRVICTFQDKMPCNTYVHTNRSHQYARERLPSPSPVLVLFKSLEPNKGSRRKEEGKILRIQQQQQQQQLTRRQATQEQKKHTHKQWTASSVRVYTDGMSFQNTHRDINGQMTEKHMKIVIMAGQFQN